tara:strand:+ start:349 stop:687 length:339 start_codon:yes stop_codon:yes gene_type:complete
MTDQTADWRMAVFRTAMPLTDEMQDVIRKDMTARAAKMRMHHHKNGAALDGGSYEAMAEKRRLAGQRNRASLWPKIKPLREQGLSATAIGARLGISASTVLRAEGKLGGLAQ